MTSATLEGSVSSGEAPVIPTGTEIEELEKGERFFTTRHGTRLAFYAYGDPRGRPVIFYHGTGSHVHGMLLHRPGLQHGFRIIAPDRPGIGRSEFRPGWTVLEYARDMADLADHLDMDTFAAIGISGGGPTLLASAFAIPERLHCVVDLACAVPVYADPDMIRHLGVMDRFYARLGSRLPLALFRIPFSCLGFMQTVMKSPKSFVRMFNSSLCPADRRIFERRDFQYLFMHDFQTLFRQGSKGPAYDAQTVYRPWGFDLAEIAVPIEVFHGTADRFVPVSFSQYLARGARHVRLNLLEGEGHFHHVVRGDRLLKKVKELFYAD
jgi:pimeloyl-ACP methyl ester carboxylesterase